MHLEKKKQNKKNNIPIKEHMFLWIFFLGIWKVFCFFIWSTNMSESRVKINIKYYKKKTIKKL